MVQAKGSGMDQSAHIVIPPCHIGGDDIKALSTGQAPSQNSVNITPLMGPWISSSHQQICIIRSCLLAQKYPVASSSLTGRAQDPIQFCSHHLTDFVSYSQPPMWVPIQFCSPFCYSFFLPQGLCNTYSLYLKALPPRSHIHGFCSYFL